MLCAAARRKAAWRGAYTGARRGCASLLSEGRELLGGLGEGEVTLEKDAGSGVATITLRNEKKKNAMSGSMMVQLADIVTALTHWPEGKAVILEAEGDIFCSGGDMSSMRANSNPRDGLIMSTFMHDTLTHLYTLPYLTVTLVHGLALGAGAEVTTATDFRIFTETGVLGFVQGRMGISTGWGGSTRLVKLVGPSTTLDLITTCRKVDGETAVKCGLAETIVDSKQRKEATLGWLAERISHVPEVVQAAKRITVAARDLPLMESLHNERQVFASLWGGPALLEALGKNIKHN